MDEFKICAGWEDRQDAPAKCRWFCLWVDVPGAELRDGVDRVMAGYYTGFSGGGCFEAEKFRAEVSGTQVLSVWNGFEDRVSGREVQWASVGDAVEDACYRAHKVVWQWNDEDQWYDSDSVYLSESRRAEVLIDGDMLLYNSGELTGEEVEVVRQICTLAGLTARPAAR